MPTLQRLPRLLTLVDDTSGGYFENCQQAHPDDPSVAGTDAAGVARYALEPETAERLWNLSVTLTESRDRVDVG